jgi:phenylalanyl-tRNA synthetase beta chain
LPVITLKEERFSKFADRNLALAEMIEWLPWLGVDIEDEGENYVKIEFNPNRIDFCCYAGVARAYKGLRGWEVGLPKYHVNKAVTTLNIDESVSEVRPYMLGGLVKDIQLDEDDIVDLMEMQEDLHWGIGRDRMKASIGVHNLDSVKPPFTFTTADPEMVKFIPLGETRGINLKNIIQRHEKGKKYNHLINGAARYPLLVDKNDEVLSMPPIINGELTKVDVNTTNLFLDVTGTDYFAVMKSLNVLSTALADMGGTLEGVKVICSDKTLISPDLNPQKMKLQKVNTNKILGLKLTESKIIQCLKKCRLGAGRFHEGVVEVTIPPFRVDILHEVDLVEEVAIGYGYYNLRPTFPSSVTIGKPHSISRTSNLIRQIMTGLGFTETMNFTITNEKLHYNKMRRKTEKAIRIANPVSSEYTIMRQDLLPNLLKNLTANKRESLPHMLFEVSDVIKPNKTHEARCERQLHVASVSSHSNSNFSEIKSHLEALMLNIGAKSWKFKKAEHPSFINGRVAAISIRGKSFGVVGEIHPEVLNNFQLETPTAAFEVLLETLIT